MGCASSNPQVTDSAVLGANGQTSQPYYTPQVVTAYGTPATPISQPSVTVNDFPSVPNTPITARAQATKLHDTVRQALVEPDEAYFALEEELQKPGVDVNAVDAEGQNALHIAATVGQESLVELLLEKGAAIDAQDFNGYTPLHLAAKTAHRDVVKSLLDRPTGAANVDQRDYDGLTAIVHATFDGHDPDLVRDLLERGADPNIAVYGDGTTLHYMVITDSMESCAMEAVRRGGNIALTDGQGNTPLHLAAQKGKYGLVEYFIGVRSDLLSVKNHSGKTPQQCAEAKGHMEVANMLREMVVRGAIMNGDVEMLSRRISSGEVSAEELTSPVDGRRNTAIHLLAERGDWPGLRAILEASPEQLDLALVIQNNAGNTPLHLVVQSGNLDAVQLLTSRSTSHQALDIRNEEGLAPIHLVAQKGGVESCQVAHEILIEVPSLVLQATEETQDTPLHLAAQEGHLDMLAMLLTRGANVNARNAFQQTPLHLAANWNNAAVVHRLLECGADPLAADSEGDTPSLRARNQGHIELWKAMLGSRLRRAAMSGDIASVKSSLNGGATTDLKEDTSGDTVLHVAARCGQTKVISAVLQSVSNPGQALALFNNDGDAPLHVAAKAGECGAIQQLVTATEANPNLENDSGDTALHIATAEGWIPCVEALVRGGADINKCSSGRGSTPLHDAACNCNLAMVQALIRLGADAKSRDVFSGNTPLHQVVQWGRPGESAAVVQALIVAGADPEAVNGQGVTPRDLARDHRSVLEVLPSKASDGVAGEKAANSATAARGSLMNSVLVSPTPSAPTMTNSEMDSHEEGLADNVYSSVVAAAQPTPSHQHAANNMEMTCLPPAPAIASTMLSGNTMTASSLPSAPTATIATLLKSTAPQQGSDANASLMYPMIFTTETSTEPPPVPHHVSAPPPPSILEAAAAVPEPIPASALTAPQPALPQEPCIPLKAVRAQAEAAPRSPFAAVQRPSPIVSTATPATPQQSSPAPAPAATAAQSSSQPTDHYSTGVLDPRLEIPYNQLKYDPRTRLGQGSFGKVYFGTLHGAKVAIKILLRNEEEEGLAIPQRIVNDFLRELNVMAGLRHDNIQALRGFCKTPEGPAIVSKYYTRGSMAETLKLGLTNAERRSELTWARRLQMAIDVAAGMMHMHAHSPPILHRDLKAINCFLDEHWRALVGDFGLTKEMENRAKSATSSGAATNPRWLAPELLTDTELGESSAYTTKTDVFAFGMTLYELLVWRAPWYNTNHWEILNRIGKGERPVIPSRLPGPDNADFEGLQEFIALMNECSAQDPRNRPEFEEIHERLEKMLEKHLQEQQERAAAGGDGSSAAVPAGRTSGRVAYPAVPNNAPQQEVPFRAAYPALPASGAQLGPMARAALGQAQPQ